MTPDLTPPTAGMTAEDVRYLNEHLRNAFLISHGTTQRILATYAALEAVKAENADRLLMAREAEDRLVAARLEVAELRAQLAEAQKDSARIRKMLEDIATEEPTMEEISLSTPWIDIRPDEQVADALLRWYAARSGRKEADGE